LQGNKSVREVCFLVGYDSVSTFSGLFTKSVGKTPSDYANEYKERKTKIQATPLAFVPGCYSYMHGWTENGNFEDVDN
jgi:AraC-like DNA-binding protein